MAARTSMDKETAEFLDNLLGRHDFTVARVSSSTTSTHEVAPLAILVDSARHFNAVMRVVGDCVCVTDTEHVHINVNGKNTLFVGVLSILPLRIPAVAAVEAGEGAFASAHASGTPVCVSSKDTKSTSGAGTTSSVLSASEFSPIGSECVDVVFVLHLPSIYGVSPDQIPLLVGTTSMDSAFVSWLQSGQRKITFGGVTADIPFLQRTVGFPCSGFDCDVQQLLSSCIDHGYLPLNTPMSLADVVLDNYRQEMDKGYALTDWSRKLSKEQVEYSAMDAVWTYRIFASMHHGSLRGQREGWVLDAMSLPAKRGSTSAASPPPYYIEHLDEYVAQFWPGMRDLLAASRAPLPKKPEGLVRYLITNTSKLNKIAITNQQLRVKLEASVGRLVASQRGSFP